LEAFIWNVLLILLALTAWENAAAQQRGTKPGDSVWVVVHHVPADKRAQYDSLMQNVWWPAVQKAGKKYPEYGKLVQERRRYVPTELGSDSTYTYVYLYFGRPEVPPSAGGGNNILRAAGLTKAQSDSFAQALRSYTPGRSTGPLVDEPYR
jgi:hypothetical protein